jgi:hypothetical protein
MIKYYNKEYVIATKHGKEQAIQPVFEKRYGMKAILSDQIDTDHFGTFSGEIERKNSPIETLRKKCLLGIDLTGTSIAIASEGSFGPHPHIPFVTCDEEFMIFLDVENDIEILERKISVETNFFIHAIDTKYELIETISNLNIPASGLLLVGKSDQAILAKKDFDTIADIKNAFDELRDSFSIVELQTDMRAHKNPQRMNVIRALAQQLCDRVGQYCPSCNTPGFGITGSRPGLPCSICHTPTRSTLALINSCIKCDYTNERFFPNDIRYEDPTYCDICNP